MHNIKSATRLDPTVLILALIFFHAPIICHIIWCHIRYTGLWQVLVALRDGSKLSSRVTRWFLAQNHRVAILGLGLGLG